MNIICDVKIDVYICEPHFDNLTSFDILTHYLNHLSPSKAGGQGGAQRVHAICNQCMYVP